MSEIISGLLLGGAFGFVLERAGFGSPCKLTAQFRLTDWSVFKVMFTAIVFTAVGLMILEKMGIVASQELFVPPAFLGAAALGGALVGAGFAIGSIEFLTSAGEYVQASTLPEALNSSDVLINACMIGAAIGVFVLGSWMEKKAGGPIQAVDAMNGCEIRK